MAVLAAFLFLFGIASAVGIVATASGKDFRADEVAPGFWITFTADDGDVIRFSYDLKEEGEVRVALFREDVLGGPPQPTSVNQNASDGEGSFEYSVTKAPAEAHFVLHFRVQVQITAGHPAADGNFTLHCTIDVSPPWIPVSRYLFAVVGLPAGLILTVNAIRAIRRSRETVEAPPGALAPPRPPP